MLTTTAMTTGFLVGVGSEKLGVEERMFCGNEHQFFGPGSGGCVTYMGDCCSAMRDGRNVPKLANSRRAAALAVCRENCNIVVESELQVSICRTSRLCFPSGWFWRMEWRGKIIDVCGYIN